MPCSSLFTNGNRHTTDRTCTGNEDIFADEIVGEGGVDGVAERIETGQNIERDGWIGVPCIGSGDGDKLRPGAGAINAHALGVGAKMSAAGKTIAAMSAGNMTFADDKIALGKPAYIAADAINFADELVPDRHRDRDRFLRPRIPVVNVNIGAANRCLQRANEDVV